MHLARMSDLYDEDWRVASRELLSIELHRMVLGDAEAGGATRQWLDDEALGMLREAVARASQPVSVPDPAAPLDPPIYEGPASEAHTWLIPGTYRAVPLYEDDPAPLVVHIGPSPVPPYDLVSAAFARSEDRGDHLERIALILKGYRQEPRRALDLIERAVAAAGIVTTHEPAPSVGEIRRAHTTGRRPHGPSAQPPLPDRREGPSTPGL